jgi:hypothetical protein
VSYRRSKKDYTVTVDRGARIALTDGRTFAVEPHPGVEFFSSYVPRGLPSGEERLHLLTQLGLNDSHRPDINCVEPEEPLYVLGCTKSADPARLLPCPGEESVLLAPGTSPVPYVASYAAEGAGWLSLAMLGVLVATVAIWWRRSFLRPVVRDLSAHARATARSGEPRDRFGLIFAGTLVVAAIAFLAIRGRSGLYLLPMGAVILACAFVYLLVGVRFRMLQAALKIVRGTATNKLAEAADEMSELVVRVASDAPRLDPIAGEHRPAFVRARIVEVLRMPGSKGNKVEVSTERAVISYPKRLAIADDATATIDMDGCRLDTVPQPSVTMQGVLRLPAWANAVLDKPIQAAEHHKEFVVHWGKLDPGDTLLVYGQVGRRRPDEGDAHEGTGGGYRNAPVALAVQGKAVAYHGDERELERSLARERLVTVPLALALLVAIAATVVASIHAATLA